MISLIEFANLFNISKQAMREFVISIEYTFDINGFKSYLVKEKNRPVMLVHIQRYPLPNSVTSPVYFVTKL